MKNSYLLIVCLLLFMGQRAWGENMTQTIHFSHSNLKNDTLTGRDGHLYSLLSYPECGIYEKAGTPTLPITTVKFNLPGTASDISVDVKLSDITTHTLEAKPYPVQLGLSFSSNFDNIHFCTCDSTIYSSATEYPTEHGWIFSINSIEDNEKEVVVEISPISYLLQENRYKFSDNVTVVVNYTVSEEKDTSSLKAITSSSLGLPFYDYCVITSRALKDSFNRLIAWKREKGLNAGAVCVEDILENEQIQSDGLSGPSDDAGKVREYLRLLHTSQSQSGKQLFVLLGGNSEVVPIRKGRVRDEVECNKNEDTKIPADWYYSELTTVWPSNENDDLQSLSYYPDFAVGRLLCSSPEEIQTYTNKLLCYELNPGNGDTSYLNKGFYLQADAGQQLHMADSVASWSSSIFTTRTVYEENPSYNAESPTFPTGNQVIAKLNEKYGYASFYTHGTPYSIQTKTNGNNNINNPYNPIIHAITSVQGADSIIVHETNNGLNMLTNALYPMFMYTASCHSAPFDTFDSYNHYPCIGKSFTVGGVYGGPAMIGNTRLGPVFSSDILQKCFIENLLCLEADRGHIGTAFNLAKYQYSGRGDVCNKKYMTLTANLIGCPEMRLWTGNPKRFSFSYDPTYYSDEFSLYVNNDTLDHTYVGIRSLNEEEETYTCYPLHVGDDNQGTINPANKVITLHGRNYLPEILPITIQNTLMEGIHYAIGKDVVCGSNIIPTLEDWQTTVVFKAGSDYTFEKRGTFTITKGVVVEKGAKLKIINSPVQY